MNFKACFSIDLVTTIELYCHIHLLKIYFADSTLYKIPGTVQSASPAFQGFDIAFSFNVKQIQEVKLKNSKIVRSSLLEKLQTCVEVVLAYVHTACKRKLSFKILYL